MLHAVFLYIITWLNSCLPVRVIMALFVVIVAVSNDLIQPFYSEKWLHCEIKKCVLGIFSACVRIARHLQELSRSNEKCKFHQYHTPIIARANSLNPSELQIICCTNILEYEIIQWYCLYVFTILAGYFVTIKKVYWVWFTSFFQGTIECNIFFTAYIIEMLFHWHFYYVYCQTITNILIKILKVHEPNQLSLKQAYAFLDICSENI